MNQIALNSLAIVIFGVTFSILLGPFLHLSPLIPTGITLGVLGFLALDVAGFQGKGLTLFLDWFAQKSPTYQARVLHHEAGHFLTAHLLKIPITGYTLSAWESLRYGQGGQGGIALSGSVTAESSSELVDRYCTVWMAGAVAETLVYGTFEGGADDRRRLKDILTRLRQDYFQKEYSAAVQARTLLKEHWSAYEALVEAMKQRASVEECSQVINHLMTSIGSTDGSYEKIGPQGKSNNENGDCSQVTKLGYAGSQLKD